jgi:hypothetical protein
MQLIQQKVQKSMIASRPRRSANRSGLATFSQVEPLGKFGRPNLPRERVRRHAVRLS